MWMILPLTELSFPKPLPCCSWVKPTLVLAAQYVARTRGRWRARGGRETLPPERCCDAVCTAGRLPEPPPSWMARGGAHVRGAYRDAHAARAHGGGGACCGRMAGGVALGGTALTPVQKPRDGLLVGVKVRGVVLLPWLRTSGLLSMRCVRISERGRGRGRGRACVGVWSAWLAHTKNTPATRRTRAHARVRTRRMRRERQLCAGAPGRIRGPARGDGRVDVGEASGGAKAGARRGWCQTQGARTAKTAMPLTISSPTCSNVPRENPMAGRTVWSLRTRAPARVRVRHQQTP